jgi:hypothetical protein
MAGQRPIRPWPGANRALSRADGPALPHLLRIYTDTEINANVKPERLSVAKKDIRSTISSDGMDMIFLAGCVEVAATFRARAAGSNLRSAPRLRSVDGAR